jgi:4-hydroxy-tetrahydrodipicolinate reductase
MKKKGLRIAVVGYGSMGKEVVRQAQEQEIEISNIFDVDMIQGTSGSLIDTKSFDFDVAIDFTYPEEVIDNCRFLAKHKKNIVIGTTGWYDNEDVLKELCTKYDIGIIYGSNFSIGMQMLFRIARYTSKLMNKAHGYDIMIHEMHHSRKKDCPSGTAITLSDLILEEVESKNSILTEAPHGRIAKDQLHISSTRGGDIIGLHTVYIDSFADTIELTHRAKNRTGFAMGAIEAAKWIKGKKGFYSFEDMLKNLWGE